ncbi:MAG: glycosyltransferase family 9 protein [Caulobacterales bacterium]
MSDATSANPRAAIKPAPADARNVLVIRAGPLPGFLQALAAAKAIRQHHVQARVTLLTTPEFAKLAETCPYFDEIDTEGRPGVDPAAFTKMVQRLRKNKYDMVYDLQGGNETNRLFQLLRPFPPKWSGAADGASHRFNPPNAAAMHPLDRLAAQLTEAGIGPPDGYAPGQSPIPDLSWVRSALRNTPRLRPSHFGLSGPFILLSPGGAEKGDKRWPTVQYSALAALILERGFSPVITGAQEERGLGAEIAGADGRIKNVIGRADIFQQIALAEDCNFAVGEETDLMHLAAAAGAPLLLFLPRGADPTRQGPRSRHGAVNFVVDDFRRLSPEEVDRALLNLGAYVRKS